MKDKFKCADCGRFIGEKDFAAGIVEVEFTPDTAFTTERTEFRHKSHDIKNKTDDGSTV